MNNGVKRKFRIWDCAWAIVAALLPTTDCLAAQGAASGPVNSSSSTTTTASPVAARTKIPPPRRFRRTPAEGSTAKRDVPINIPPPRQFVRASEVPPIVTAFQPSPYALAAPQPAPRELEVPRELPEPGPVPPFSSLSPSGTDSQAASTPPKKVHRIAVVPVPAETKTIFPPAVNQPRPLVLPTINDAEPHAVAPPVGVAAAANGEGDAKPSTPLAAPTPVESGSGRAGSDRRTFLGSTTACLCFDRESDQSYKGDGRTIRR